MATVSWWRKVGFGILIATVASTVHGAANSSTSLPPKEQRTSSLAASGTLLISTIGAGKHLPGRHIGHPFNCRNCTNTAGQQTIAPDTGNRTSNTTSKAPLQNTTSLASALTSSKELHCVNCTATSDGRNITNQSHLLPVWVKLPSSLSHGLRGVWSWFWVILLTNFCVMGFLILRCLHIPLPLVHRLSRRRLGRDYQLTDTYGKVNGFEDTDDPGILGIRCVRRNAQEPDGDEYSELTTPR